MHSWRTVLAVTFVAMLMPIAANAEIVTLYTTLAGGYSEVDTSALDDDGDVYRLLVGVKYRDRSMPGFEIGYINFDKLKNDVIEIEADGFTFGVAGEIPIGYSLTVRGRMGMMAWDLDYDSGVDPYFSAGVGMQIGADAVATLEFEKYELGEVEIDAVVLGVQLFEEMESRLLRRR